VTVFECIQACFDIFDKKISIVKSKAAVTLVKLDFYSSFCNYN